jgi:hypothetical protein
MLANIGALAITPFRNAITCDGTAHKHAVTSLSTGETYTYDANGNTLAAGASAGVSCRVEGGITYKQEYNIENLLPVVKKVNGTCMSANAGSKRLMVPLMRYGGSRPDTSRTWKKPGSVWIICGNTAIPPMHFPLAGFFQNQQRCQVVRSSDWQSELH